MGHQYRNAKGVTDFKKLYEALVEVDPVTTANANNEATAIALTNALKVKINEIRTIIS